ncbi:MAG TPA: serine hydrolase [Hyphomonadaceae bacterium]|nr:serine hydrolase [Hyphomonadaceae bacterium]
MKPLVLAAAFALGLSACTAAAQSPTNNLPPDAIYVDPAAAGWNASALAGAVDYVAGQKSTGFVVIQDDHIIAERYWPLADDAAVFRANFVHGTAPDGALLEDVASQQKSFVAILIGVGVDKMLIDIEKPVSAYAGAGWSKASPEQEARITVRHLMEMNSGLKENLAYEAQPGTKFFYNTPAYAILKKVLEGASKQTLDAVTTAWLTAPAGMKDTSWRKRPGAFSDVGNPTGLVTTPRDVARMGQLVLDGGKAADGTRVISKTQLDALFKRTSTNPSYGHLWWLNGGSFSLSPGAAISRSEGQLIPAAPADLVTAQGAQDRKLYVVPSRKLIVVRTGQATPDRDFNQQLWTRLMQAVPKK